MDSGRQGRPNGLQKLLQKVPKKTTQKDQRECATRPPSWERGGGIHLAIRKIRLTAGLSELRNGRVSQRWENALALLREVRDVPVAMCELMLETFRDGNSLDYDQRIANWYADVGTVFARMWFVSFIL